MGAARAPALSVVVPVLNEAAGLPEIFATMAAQRDVSLELVLCDGGSKDGTPELARRLGETTSFPCRIVGTAMGRGRQMNAGAAAALGSNLLFLHADCRFPDPGALASGLFALEKRIEARGDGGVAGRFALRFRRSENAPSASYFFYEGKARLDRLGCIHGDQGFMLRRSFFETVGPFDEGLLILEDDRFVKAVGRSGEWILLPAEIETSARRFETEGLLERQILNAFIMNFAAIGWDEPLRRLPDLYRSQDRTTRLDLVVFFDRIAELLAPLPRRRRLELWYRTGAYVLSNAWQLAFACDQRGRFRRGDHPAPAKNPCLERFDRWIEPLIDHAPGHLSAALLTWASFHATRRRLRRRRAGGIPE